jgi:DNA replication factor GINS
MDIDELLLVLEKSRMGKIQKIDEDFYERLKTRINELEELRKKSKSEREVLRIEDELRTLKRIRRRIFEARTSKIVRAAWAEVCETESGIEGLENLIECEKNLFKLLTEVITEFKKSILERLENKNIEDGYVLVRVKSDIPEFEGIDGKTYKLRREDVVTLPTLNANALIKGDAVELIKVKK